MREDTGLTSFKFSLSDTEFTNLTKVIERKTGLMFTREKQRELQIKLDKLKTTVIPNSTSELICAAKESNDVLQKIVNVLTVGESYFFRNKPHFSVLRKHVFPRLIEDAQRTKSLHIWCAGCAGGEEPYSIAILLKDEFPFTQEWNIKLTATDINTDFLTRARAGVFRKWSFRGVDESIIRKHFDSKDNEEFFLHDDIKQAVNFQRFNLFDFLNGERLFEDRVDLLLCRNVLIYFPFQISDRIVSEFSEVLRPGGYLFVGHSEAFPALGNLEAIYSDATYYYRKHQADSEIPIPVSVPLTASIPGLGISSAVVRNSMMPKSGFFRRVSKLPSILPFFNVKETLDKARELADNGCTADALSMLQRLTEGELRLDHRAHFLSALIADQAGYSIRASDSLKRAIFLQKNFVVGHYYLGVICLREGNNIDAKRHLKNVVKLLDELQPDTELEEAEGLTAGRLSEIVNSLFMEIEI